MLFLIHGCDDEKPCDGLLGLSLEPPQVTANVGEEFEIVATVVNNAGESMRAKLWAEETKPRDEPVPGVLLIEHGSAERDVPSEGTVKVAFTGRCLIEGESSVSVTHEGSLTLSGQPCAMFGRRQPPIPVTCVDDSGTGGSGGAGGSGGTGGAGGAGACGGSLSPIAGVVDPAQLTSVEQSGTGNTTKGSDDVATCVSEGQTDIGCIAADIVPATELNFANWSCGPSSLGEVVCPPGAPASTAGDGDHLAVAVVLDSPVPLADPTLYYQYGWVFDSDGLAGNNFQAASAYPADFFIDTDLWVQLHYIPGSGWEMSVSDIVGNSPVPRFASKAKILIADDVLLLLSPDEELLGSASYPNARYRLSAFRHDGDYLNGFWNGDVHPPVTQPLLSVPQP